MSSPEFRAPLIKDVRNFRRNEASSKITKGYTGVIASGISNVGKDRTINKSGVLRANKWTTREWRGPGDDYLLIHDEDTRDALRADLRKGNGVNAIVHKHTQQCYGCRLSDLPQSSNNFVMDATVDAWLEFEKDDTFEKTTGIHIVAHPDDWESWWDPRMFGPERVPRLKEGFLALTHTLEIPNVIYVVNESGSDAAPEIVSGLANDTLNSAEKRDINSHGLYIAELLHARLAELLQKEAGTFLEDHQLAG